MSRLQHFELLSEQALANSPSRKDGVSPEFEANRRRLAARHIYETGHTFKMSAGTSAIAVTLYLRYFSRKSLKRNDPFIIAAGCLFLAGKVNDEPISAQHIVVEMFKRWYGRDNLLMRQRLADPACVQTLYTSVIEAERAILYTVGFDFNVDIPISQVAVLLRLPRFEYLKHNVRFHQLAVNFCNDIMRKDGTMVLQYTAREIALAVYYYILKAAKQEGLDDIQQPVPEPDGVHWYLKEGLSVERCAEITKRISRLYRSAGPGAAASSQPAVSVATTVMPGMSVGGGGGAESVAAGGSAAGAGEADGMGGDVDSVARQPSLAGQKRGLEGEALAAPSSKRPALDAGQQQQQQPNNAAPAAAPEPAPEPASSQRPVEASEPEEGELEEGELP